MIKSKSIFVVIMMVLVLALILPACAPAKPVTPPATTPPAAPPATPPPAAPPAVADQTYTNAEYGFTIKYPGTWKEGKPSVATTIFFAQGPGGGFDDFFQVNIRPADNFKDAVLAWVTEQVASKKIDAKPVIVSEKAIKLSDGRDGYEVIGEVDAIIMKLGSDYHGFMKDGKAVMINVGGILKPNVDKYAQWEKILNTLTFAGAAAPATTTPPAAAAPAIKTSFEAATYTNDQPGFSVTYPKAWGTRTSTLAGVVFYGVLDANNIIVIGVRPATNFKDAAVTFLSDFIAAAGASFVPSVDGENTVTLADGKTQANEIVLSVAFGLKKGVIYGVLKDGKAIMVLVALDPKNMELYKEIGKTLTLK